MRITPIVLIALCIDMFMLFGAPALIGGIPIPITNHPINPFVSGDMAHPENLTLNNGTIYGWLNLEPASGNLFTDTMATIGGLLGTLAIFATFITSVVLSMITFPFTLFTSYHISPMFAVIIGVIYSLLNITAAIDLASGRQT